MLLRLLCFFLVLLAVSTPNSAQETAQPVPVKVGGYEFEPFVEKGLGITPALLTLLNQMQDDYSFEFVLIPAQRRYAMLTDGQIDAIFFEMMRWGWQPYADKVEVTRPLLKTSEAFYARADHALGREVFKNIENRRLALTLGYHYAFADYQADQGYIRERFTASFAPSQRVALRLMLAGSADLAIVSDVFFLRELARNPSLEDQVVHSPEIDQTYELPLMVRKSGPITTVALSSLLARAEAAGTLASFLKTYGIAELLMSHR